METRVRFAPSPTGQVHIGNIRTAIFNWLFARHKKGKFLLRIEDTDLERSTEEAINALLECMEWLGLDYDEEILYQTSQRSAHEAAAKRLFDEGKAYYGKADENGKAPMLFRIPFDSKGISAIRTAGKQEISLHPEQNFTISYSGVKYYTVSKKGKAVENLACLAGFKDLKLFDSEDKVVFDLKKNIEQVQAGEDFDVSGAVKMTFTRREVFYKDMIKGELAKPLDGIKDLVIMRGDGSPIFHLANVCDDILQEVNYIVRGDDHVENTYRHILLYNALGEKAPHYAHMPMIVNQSGKPYSKRDGDAFVGDFRKKGFLSEALFNYLALLGWSPGDDREKMTKDEMIKAFDLLRVKSSPAQFDSRKLLNMNGMYIAELPFEVFAVTASRYFNKFDWAKGTDIDKFALVAGLMKSRTKDFTQVESWKYFFSDELEYGGKQFKKQMKKDENRAGLKTFAEKLEKASEFTKESVADMIAASEKENGLDAGKLFPAVRMAVTAAAGGADLDQTVFLIGSESCRKRIDMALKAYEEQK